jgi:hypothetical protein
VPGDSPSAAVMGSAPARGWRRSEHAGRRIIGAARRGVPPGTVRGWLGKLCAWAAQLLEEATSGIGFLVAVAATPETAIRPHPGPLGSLLGDALAASAACVHAAIRWHGHAEEDLNALTGRFSLARRLGADVGPARIEGARMPSGTWRHPP